MARIDTIIADMDEWEKDCNLQFPWTSSNSNPSLILAEFDVSGTIEFADTITANVISFLLGAKVALHTLSLTYIPTSNWTRMSLKQEAADQSRS